MPQRLSLFYIDGDSPAKRRARIKTIGKTFMLYEQQWRSGPYYFGDLVYLGKDGEAHIYGLKDGIKDRSDWRLQLKGDIPDDLAARLPGLKKPMISNIGMVIIAFICLAIVYFASA